VTELSLLEAVPLAHAVVDRVAEGIGIRALFIKGPVAVEQRLRRRRSSVDVDALVDPARRAELAAALIGLGWADLDPRRSPTVLPRHSLTLRHPWWPCELDLHDRFPGLFADRQHNFERLWERRTHVEVAAREIWAPDPLGHALILGLHSLRDPYDPGKRADLTELVANLPALVDESGLQELAELARDLGAADTAASFLDEVGCPPVGRGSTSAEDLRVWRLRTEPVSGTSVGWIEELRRLPKRSWPGYLWYAAVLSEQELRLQDASMPEGARAVWRARGRRLRRGFGALPAAVRSVRRTAR
jgi:hypothetical protein